MQKNKKRAVKRMPVEERASDTENNLDDKLSDIALTTDTGTELHNAAASSEPVDLLIGVGASSGGLDAISSLLRALPEEPGFSLVLVQHMSPHHESMLATLLTASTNLPVRQVNGETVVRPNHVYVISPNTTLRYESGKLIPGPRTPEVNQYTPIDDLFVSLAEGLTDRAVGIVLSGTGQDGREGVVAIKNAGGSVIVQDPESAKFQGMPEAAIATGKVDLVLPPAQIADELLQLAQQLHDSSPRSAKYSGKTSIEPKHLEQIFLLLRNSTGVDFNQYKVATIQRRIQRRMALHKIPSVNHYIKYLKENPPEISLLFQDIFIHVTGFFREPESFDSLAEHVFPTLMSARRTDSPLRIWVPGCATGEEPYSIAIRLIEFLESRGDAASIQIFATDISESAVEKARLGIYPPSIAEDVSAERLRRYFSHADGHYRINKAVRDLCVFARQDLTRDPPFSKIDLIVCRNVLIYLGQSVQSRLITLFHYALKPTGFLMLGSAETIGAQADLFSNLDKKHRIYRKKLADIPTDLNLSAPYARPPGRATPPAHEVSRGAPSIQTEVNRLILDRYVPASVVVNEDWRIIQFRGQTGRYLEPAPGDANLNLLKMCREGLLHGLRSCLQAAKKTRTPSRRDGLRVVNEGRSFQVGVEVAPIENIPNHFLVLFHESTANASLDQPEAKGSKRKAKRSSDEVERLQAELTASREYLQSIIQDLEATNEELQSANEEILSSNEELQSTNEELDTAKEELQSTNEELNTVNEQLHSRNEELATINSDLVNLLNGVRIAILIVASDLRIRRFTPMAERILNLIPGDIGRPITQIKPNINCPGLERLIAEVIETVSVQHLEVQDHQGRWFSMTIRPYKNVDNRIDGAVIALWDIDDAHRSEKGMLEAKEFADSILDTIHEGFVAVDSEGRIRTANNAFLRLLRLPHPATGKLLSEIGADHRLAQQLQTLVSEISHRDAPIGKTELHYQDSSGNHRRFAVNARKRPATERGPELILLALEEAFVDSRGMTRS